MTRSRLLLLSVLLAVPLSAAPAPDSAVATDGYATAEQIAALSAADRADFIAIIHDATWAPRHVDYLRGAQSVEPEDFAKLPKDRQGAIVLEWLRGRAKARDYVKSLSGDATLPGDALPTLQTFARAGFLSPLLTKSVLGAGSPVLANLSGASITAGADARAKLAKLFDDETNTRQLAGADQSVVDNLHLMRLGSDAGKGTDDLTRMYETAREMVDDPAGFRRSRPDVAAASTPAELRAQDNLAAKVGHVYANIDQLRAQGHFELVWASAGEMKNSMMDTSIVAVPGGNGATTWKIRVRVNDSYRNVDPVLVASTLTHEFLHAYDMTQHIQKSGPSVAQLVPDFQEEEMRAFTAGSAVDIAYGSAMDRLADNNPYNGGARTLIASSQELRELGQIAGDPPAYQAALAVLANTELQRRGYMNNVNGMNDVATMARRYKTTEKHLKAEQIVALHGLDGLEKEIAKARAQGDYEYVGFLLAAKSVSTRPAADVAHDLELNEGVLKILNMEKDRGLALQQGGGLATQAPPPPAAGGRK